MNTQSNNQNQIISEINEKNSEKNKEENNNFKETIKFLFELLVIYIILILINTFVASIYRVNWQSMDNTLYDQQLIITDKISELNRWDIVVFKSPSWIFYIKRLIWIPWDTIKIWNWKLNINWKEVQEDYLNEFNQWNTHVRWSYWTSVFELKEDQYFVIWDNRNNSTDSRTCFWDCSKNTPFISKNDINWKVLIDLWYFDFFKFSFKNQRNESSFPTFLWLKYKNYDYWLNNENELWK